MAQFEYERSYATPWDAPMFARMRVTEAAGPRPHQWFGEVVLQDFDTREEIALRKLVTRLAELQETSGLDVPDLEFMQTVCGALERAAANRSAVSWEQQPFPRAHKPRRARTLWLNTETGKYERRYKDTLQRFAHQPMMHEDESDS